MTTPTIHRTPGTASRKQCDRIIATPTRHTGNQDLPAARPRADATNRVPAPITHRGCPMNRSTCPNRRNGVGASGHNQTLRNPDGRWGAGR